MKEKAKMIIKQLIPPIILEWRKKFRIKKGKKNYKSNQKIYNSFIEALSDCVKSGYDNEEIAEVVFRKTEIYKNYLSKISYLKCDFATSSLLVSLFFLNNSNEINVLDFGGACGAHYFQCRKVLPENIKLNWVVIEKPQMIKYAKKWTNNELSFAIDLNKALKNISRIDIFHASAIIQYLDEPYKYLDLILESNAKYLLFNRMIFTLEDDDLITIQNNKLSWNGIGKLPYGFTDRLISYPLTIIKKHEFYKIFENKYKIVLEFNNEPMGFENDNSIVNSGILYRLRNDL